MGFTDRLLFLERLQLQLHSRHEPTTKQQQGPATPPQWNRAFNSSSLYVTLSAASGCCVRSIPVRAPTEYPRLLDHSPRFGLPSRSPQSRRTLGAPTTRHRFSRAAGTRPPRARWWRPKQPGRGPFTGAPEEQERRVLPSMRRASNPHRPGGRARRRLSRDGLSQEQEALCGRSTAWKQEALH